MADGNKAPKGRKVIVNLSWLYILLFIGIGYLLFRNQQSASPEKIEWTEVQGMIRSGDVAEITFVRNDFKGEVKVKPDRLAKYTDKFAGGNVPRRAPHFYFLVSTKFDPEVSFAQLNAELEPGDQFKVVIRNEEHIWGEVLQMIVPLLLFILFWVWIFRGMNRGPAWAVPAVLAASIPSIRANPPPRKPIRTR